MLGVIVFCIEFITALPYFYSIFLLNHLSIPSISSIVVIIGYNLVMVLPSLLLIGISIVFKDKLQHFLDNIKTNLNEVAIYLVLVVILLVGAVFFSIWIILIST